VRINFLVQVTFEAIQIIHDTLRGKGVSASLTKLHMGAGEGVKNRPPKKSRIIWMAFFSCASEHLSTVEKANMLGLSTSCRSSTNCLTSGSLKSIPRRNHLNCWTEHWYFDNSPFLKMSNVIINYGNEINVSFKRNLTPKLAGYIISSCSSNAFSIT